MKKRFSILTAFLLSLSVALFTSCSSDDSENTGTGETTLALKDLPSSAQTFVTDHFDANSVNSILKSGQGYGVTLANYKIEFDQSGNWVDIEAYNDGALPATVLALIPRTIVNYVSEYYPERSISEISVETYGYDVDLTGNPDIDLKFDANGNILSQSNGNSSNEQKVDISALPQTAQTFVTTHFGNLTVSYIEKDDDSYDVTFTNNLEVDFDLTGAWKKVDANNNTLPESVINLLPATAVTYINTNYAGKRIEDIERKVSGYEVEIYNDIKLVFDASGNLWSESGSGNSSGNTGNNNSNNDRVDYGSLPQTAITYVNTHFSDVTVRYVEKDDDEYEVKLSDGSEVSFDLSGNMKTIEVVRAAGVPESAVLSSILSYVKANYSTKVIMEYSKKTRGYEVELSGYPEIDLLFDLNGNFLGRD